MRLKVDPDECAGYGICVKILPTVFELDESGYATVTSEGVVPPELEPEGQRAVDECPVKAIARLVE